MALNGKYIGSTMMMRFGLKRVGRSLYYSLNHGHLLFFEYEETLCFDVHIFDNSALEIDYPFHSTNDEKVEVVQIGDESVEILDDEKIRLEFTLSSPQPCKKIKNCIITNVERDSNELNLHQPVQTRSTRSQKAMPELDEEESKDVSNTEFPKVKQLTSTALTKATAFRSEHPSFMVTMNPAYIYGDYLDIPPHFSKQYLKKTCAVVNLEVLDGRSWTVICSASRITWGWKKFASENNLDVGDTGVFELIQKIQGPAFKVSILPAAGEPSCPISQGGSSSQSCSRLESHLKPKILTAIEEASRFTSENPFFIVTLTLDRASKEKLVRYPSMAVNFGRKYFSNMDKNTMMIQFRNKLWPVKFTLNGYAGSGIFSVGWISFARENKLQPEDVCIFELVNRQDVTFNLHVFGSRN